ncbi:phage Gp37/Gp68 family protein [Paraburkholderia agricolaris]|uniref:Phage Gp37/Gp68 family protein n=1 Tax=Paraburkholderia agricolaris TaxID=2152888 RepID=A0ABW8ZU99_9BURK
MSENSSIEWTDHTFNTHWGCSKISPRCDNCYAESLARRFGYGWGDTAIEREFNEGHWNELLRWDRKAGREGVRHRVFTNSMFDLFDRFAPAGVRERHWQFVARTPDLDHLLLTKRVGNVRRMVPTEWLSPGRWPAKVWISASIVNQDEADRDIPKLLALPAAIRFLSMEPLLGPVSLKHEWMRRLGGVFVGGASGREARPMHPAWAYSLRDQCAATGLPFLFKQWGQWSPVRLEPDTDPHDQIRRGALRIVKADGTIGGCFRPGAGDVLVGNVGKALAGRLLDGRVHDDIPSVRHHRR